MRIGLTCVGIPQVAKAFEALAIKYNSVAMRLTEEGQYAAAQSLLTKAEFLSEQVSADPGFPLKVTRILTCHHCHIRKAVVFKYMASKLLD